MFVLTGRKSTKCIRYGICQWQLGLSAVHYRTKLVPSLPALVSRDPATVSNFQCVVDQGVQVTMFFRRVHFFNARHHVKWNE